METIEGVDKFRRAAERAGLEWLGEFDLEDTPPDDDFVHGKRPDKDLPRRLYLTIANQTAIRQLLSLWKKWKSNGKDALPHGFKLWDKLLERLQDIRLWGPQERLAETGVLEDWAESVKLGQDTVRFQAELWYRDAEAVRDEVHDRVVRLIRRNKGTVISRSVISEIQYHGLLAELPIKSIQKLLDTADADLVLAQDVMFYRPCSQAAVSPAPGDQGDPTARRERPLPEGEPVIALLDGLPVANHELLRDRVTVVDPDDWSASCPARSREHGTSMASLIIHGDLAQENPALPMPLLVHPVMKARQFNGRSWEEIPDDQLAVDLVHQAVRRICDPGASNGTNTIRVINISLGDLCYPFHGFLSPWARLLDWLSVKYGVLFVVSAGNDREVALSLSREKARAMDDSELQVATLSAVAIASRHRAILSPAEGLNVLTVGASHEDASAIERPPGIRELIGNQQLLAPYSRLGLGYRRAIKPDLLAPGGRGWYREVLHSGDEARYELVDGQRAGGLQHACPGDIASATSHTRRSVGTSNAAAICSRSLGFAYESLRPLIAEVPGDRIQHGHEALLLRALSVHTADWAESRRYLEPILNGLVETRRTREHISRFMGYGVLRPDRMLRCTDQRATVMGLAVLAGGDAHQYRLPLPLGMGGYRGYKRLTVTLSWFTPINPRHRTYKRAALSFDLPHIGLPLDRTQGHHEAVKRGTIQHEVLEGEKASAIGDHDAVIVNVNCRAAAGALEQAIPYSLICSLEVADGVDISVYEEIRQRLRARVRATPSPGAADG